MPSLSSPNYLPLACPPSCLRDLRRLIVRLPRYALRPEEPDPADCTGEAISAGDNADRPSLLSRMQELHARGEQDLYA